MENRSKSQTNRKLFKKVILDVLDVLSVAGAYGVVILLIKYPIIADNPIILSILVLFLVLHAYRGVVAIIREDKNSSNIVDKLWGMKFYFGKNIMPLITFGIVYYFRFLH